MGHATLTAETVLILMMIAIGAIWLILDQLARALSRGRAAIALQAEVSRLAAEKDAASDGAEPVNLELPAAAPLREAA